MWLNDVDREDGMLIGRKAASMGQMNQAGFVWSQSFIITPIAYLEFIKYNGLDLRIRHLLGTINPHSHDSLAQGSSEIQKLIRGASIPSEVTGQIFSAFHNLGGIIKTPAVALTSISFADEILCQESPITGEAQLADTVRRSWAAQFSVKELTAILKSGKVIHTEAVIIVQKIIDAKLSGKIYTSDIRSNDKKKMLVTAQFGNLSDAVPFDTYKIDKNDLRIIAKEITQQDTYLNSDSKEKRVPMRNRKKQKAPDEIAEKVAMLGRHLEEYLYFPQEICWTYDGKNILITDTRPITTFEDQKKKDELERSKTPLFMKAFLAGEGVNPGVASGKVKIVKRNLEKTGKGDVLVLEGFSYKDAIFIKKASALILEKRGAHFHPGVKNLGIPVVIAPGASQRLRDEMVVTVNGKSGQVFKGGFFSSEVVGTQKVLPTKTKILTRLTQNQNFSYISDQYVDGVFIEGSEVMKKIGIHPKKLFLENKEQLISKELEQYLENVAKIFYPRPVIYSPIDLDSNEYLNLVGGKMFELFESTPFLGLKGAYRVISDPALFLLELKTVKKMREKKDLNNIQLLMPFPRSIWELRQIKKKVSESGLKRSTSFSVIMPIAVPSVAYQIDTYLTEGVDGVLIKVRDLARLVLGVDPENSDLLPLFHEDEASLVLLYEDIIRKCEKYKTGSFMCDIDSKVFTPVIEAASRSKVGNIIVDSDKNILARDIIYSIEGRN